MMLHKFVTQNVNCKLSESQAQVVQGSLLYIHNPDTCLYILYTYATLARQVFCQAQQTWGGGTTRRH